VPFSSFEFSFFNQTHKPLSWKRVKVRSWHIFSSGKLKNKVKQSTNERVNQNPHVLHFKLKRNKNFPNSRLPVLIYKEGLQLPKQKNRAARIIETIFTRNGWSNCWSNGIYDFHHYHSITHECMAVSKGTVRIILGGPNGKSIQLEQGDVLILPAGVAHKRLRASKDFLCVGGYPQGKDYDMNYGLAAELNKTLSHIRKLSSPACDPLYGDKGFLKAYWK
jgi:uncharacterized protein YjlB